MAEIKKKTLRLTTLAVLGALAIVLSALENLIQIGRASCRERV